MQNRPWKHFRQSSCQAWFSILQALDWTSHDNSSLQTVLKESHHSLNGCRWMCFNHHMFTQTEILWNAIAQSICRNATGMCQGRDTTTRCPLPLIDEKALGLTAGDRDRRHLFKAACVPRRIVKLRTEKNNRETWSKAKQKRRNCLLGLWINADITTVSKPRTIMCCANVLRCYARCRRIKTHREIAAGPVCWEDRSHQLVAHKKVGSQAKEARDREREREEREKKKREEKRRGGREI